MALTVIRGRKDVGAYADEAYTSKMDEILMALEHGNMIEVQAQNELNAFFETIEKQVPREEGSPISVKRKNILFQKGGIATTAPEFHAYLDKFEMRTSMGYNVMAYDYSQEDLIRAENHKIDLDSEATENTVDAVKVYHNTYLPFNRLLALITGCSLTTSIPEKVDGGKYNRAFGWLRGDDCSDILPATETVKKRNHYRTIKGDSVKEDDIYDVVQSIQSFRTYSRQGIVVVGHPRRIQKLAQLYSAPTNVDKMLLEGIMVKSFLGVEWFETTSMHPDFLMFLDKGKVDLLIRGVELSEKFRGIGIFSKKEIRSFESTTDEDVMGAKVRIFPEEWYVVLRESGAILDCNGTRKDNSGEMQTASVNELQKFTKALMESFDLEEYIKSEA